jgi:dolichol-phosphate mannosyltransferase
MEIRPGMKKSVSVILPAYNEKGNIVGLCEEILAAVSWAGYRCQIVIVDDNSPDGTFDSVRELMKKHRNVKGILRTSERGLATAIMRGIRESSGEIIVLMDCDFSHPPADIPRLLAEIENGADAAFASRYVRGGKMKTDRLQFYLSLLFNGTIKVLLNVAVLDCTNGFFAMRRDALSGLPMERVFSGYGDYCFKLLYALKRKKKIVEIPFHYMPRRYGNSKTSLLKTGLSYGIGALKLRLGL